MKSAAVGRRQVLQLAAGALAACSHRPPTAQPPVRAPGVAIAYLRRDGQMALESRGGLLPTDSVQVASLSKPVFAFGVLGEVARGALSLDAPLPTLAPPPYTHRSRAGFDGFEDPRVQELTPRLLLSHRGGLPNWSRTGPLSFVDPPGARWSYSGEGYVLLQHVLETARGESLDAFAARTVFDPLGMRRSSYHPVAGKPVREGHDRSGNILDVPSGEANAASSLVSSAEEYATFVRALVSSPATDAVVNAMVTDQGVVDRERRISWGLGVGLAAPEWIFHWGANPGFRSLFVGSRARGEAVVVLTDSEAGMELAADVVRECFGDLPLLGFPMLYPPD